MSDRDNLKNEFKARLYRYIIKLLKFLSGLSDKPVQY